MSVRSSGCLIVRNEAAQLSECLVSIREVVDEIVVIDTGSTDDTRGIASAFGAVVREFAWCDDFSSARNESLRFATGEWIFWIDADERLSLASQQEIARLLGTLGTENRAYYMRQVSSGCGNTVTDQVRLFRAHSAARWTHRVHEQLLPSLRAIGYDECRTSIEIEHFGYADPDLLAQKWNRNLHLLRLDLDEHPNNEFVLFNLGALLLDMEGPDSAIPHLRRSIELVSQHEPFAAKIASVLARAYRQFGVPAWSIETCRRARLQHPNAPELLFEEGLAHYARRDLKSAKSCFLELIAGPEPAQYRDYDSTLSTVKGRHNLAAIYRDHGRFNDALNQWETILREHPDHSPSLRGAGELLAAQGRCDEAGIMANRLASIRYCFDAAMVQYQIAMIAKDYESARSSLESAARAAPKEVVAKLLLAQLLSQKFGDTASAVSALREVLATEPENVIAKHNLDILVNTCPSEKTNPDCPSEKTNPDPTISKPHVTNPRR